MRRFGTIQANGQQSPAQHTSLQEVLASGLGFRQKSVHTEYHCANEHKLGHSTHGLDKDLAACALFPGRVNRRNVGRGKLWKISEVSRPGSRTGKRLAPRSPAAR
jgi:hypothetical protein